MSFLAPLATTLAPVMNAMGTMARLTIAPIALTTVALLSGCGGDGDELGGPDGGGRPPQDPIVPDPSDEDPCEGLEGEDLADCLAEEGDGVPQLPPHIHLRLTANEHVFNGNPSLNTSSYLTVTRTGENISADDVSALDPDLVAMVQTADPASVAYFRGIGQWTNRPADFQTSPDLSWTNIANSVMQLREHGDSICNLGYETNYSGFNEYGYPVPGLNFCGIDTAENPLIPIGLVYSCVGAYDLALGELILHCRNTIGGAQPADLDNPQDVSVFSLYSNSGLPEFWQPEDVPENPEPGEFVPTPGFIKNEQLMLLTGGESYMIFDVGQGFDASSYQFCSGCTDLDGNTASTFSVELVSPPDSTSNGDGGS